MVSKRKERRKKRKLLFAIIMVLFVGIVLTTSTYAWFTANQTVTVDDINVNVATSSGIQISVDGSDWKALITNADIQSVGGQNRPYPAAVNQLPSSMVPVSTIGALDSTTAFMKMYRGTIEANATTGVNELNSVASVETNGTSGDFVVFDLFFKVTEALTVYLTDESEVVTSDATSKGIENAARIAFINEGNTSASSTVSTIQQLKNTSATPIIWEPNFDAHTQAGINNASSVYAYDTPWTESGGSYTCEAASGHQCVLEATGERAQVASYYGVKTTFTGEPLNSHDTSKFSVVTPTIQTEKVNGIQSSAYQNVFSLAAGITKIRIYMWIEGQDVDCEDNASGSNLTFSLQFSILEHA